MWGHELSDGTAPSQAGPAPEPGYLLGARIVDGVGMTKVTAAVHTLP